MKLKELSENRIDIELDDVLSDHSVNENHLLFETEINRTYHNMCGVGRRVISDWIWY